MKSSLTINREGQFRLYTYGDNHCGTMNNFILKYHFKCKCKSDVDHRGFLFDQVKIDEYMKDHDETNLSCEEFCMKLAKGLVELIHKENPNCKIKRGSLKLSPEPFAASITYKF